MSIRIQDKNSKSAHPNVQGVPKKMSHSWEPNVKDTLHAETKHQLDLKLRQQRVLMSTPCSQNLRPNRLV